MPTPDKERIEANERLRQAFDSMWDYYDTVANDSSESCDIAIANALDNLKASLKPKSIVEENTEAWKRGG